MTRLPPAASVQELAKRLQKEMQGDHTYRRAVLAPLHKKVRFVSPLILTVTR